MNSRALVFTAESLLQILKSLPTVNAYIVGFSGGADSTALLHALSKIHPQLGVPVSAVHVNHGIHPDADDWQLECENFCRQHGIALTCQRIMLKSHPGKGLEAEARHLRYEAIANLLEPADCLLTAHHANDQAETLLLNLMRGSGVDGLSGMPDSRALGPGFLQRPLLRFKSSALRDYLHRNKIDWTEDPSNQYLDHDRNFVRHEVIPLLEQRWPEVGQRLLLTREAMSGARRLLENIADDYLGINLVHPFVLHISPPCLANTELLKLLIRRWLKETGATGIPAYPLDSFCEQVQQTGNDHNTAVHWDGWTLRWYKNQLWLHTAAAVSPCPFVKWPDRQSTVNLGDDAGQLVLRPTHAAENGRELLTSVLPDGEFAVGGRASMEASVISQRGHHRSLKNIFQASDIPPWLRDSIPLCELNGELVAVGDWCLNERFASWLSENELGLNWQPAHPLLQFILKRQHDVKH